MSVFLGEKKAEKIELPDWVHQVAGWGLANWNHDLRAVAIQGPERADRFANRKLRPSVLLPTLEGKKVFLNCLVWCSARGLNLIKRREVFVPGHYARYARAFIRIEVGLNDFIGDDKILSFGASGRTARELSEISWDWPEGRRPCWALVAGKPAQLRREIAEFRETRNARLSRKRAS